MVRPLSPALLLVVAGCQASTAAPPLSQPAGMVALPDGPTLLWSSAGVVQIAQPQGTLGPAIQTPLTYVVEAAPDAQGALLAGSIGAQGQQDQATVILVGPDGATLQRWDLGPGIAASAQSAAGTRLATSFSGLVTLDSEGATTRLSDTPHKARVRADERHRLLCTPANRTMADQAPPRCHLLDGEAGWTADGQWTRTPTLCGDWLVEPGPDAAQVRGVADGAVVGRFALPPDAPLACEGANTILVGGEGVQRLHLPDGALVDTTPCGTGDIIALAAGPQGPRCLSADGHVHALR